MPLTSAEHNRRLEILLKGKEAGLSMEAMAVSAGMYGGSFYNWVKRYHPEHLPPPRKREPSPQPVPELRPSKMLTPEQTELRLRVWMEGNARGATWTDMAREVGCCAQAFQEWVFRNIPGAQKTVGKRNNWLREHIAAKNRPEREAPRPKKRRPCITCSDPFDSEGPGHRMCGECRSRAASSSPYEPDYGRSARQMPARRA